METSRMLVIPSLLKSYVELSSGCPTLELDNRNIARASLHRVSEEKREIASAKLVHILSSSQHVVFTRNNIIEVF